MKKWKVGETKETKHNFSKRSECTESKVGVSFSLTTFDFFMFWFFYQRPAIFFHSSNRLSLSSSPDIYSLSCLCEKMINDWKNRKWPSPGVFTARYLFRTQITGTIPTLDYNFIIRLTFISNVRIMRDESKVGENRPVVFRKRARGVSWSFLRFSFWKRRRKDKPWNEDARGWGRLQGRRGCCLTSFLPYLYSSSFS